MDSEKYAIVEKSLSSCLIHTELPIGNKYIGKVRDTYDLGEYLVLVTTDRQSAFDRYLAAVPYKGQILNTTSAWWFDKTKAIAPNHLIAVPHPNVMLAKKCTVFPIEFVVRGYITGSTNTSLWTQYHQGNRTYCGIHFPDGLQKNQPLPAPILTPTTKEKDHDRPISPVDIVKEGWMTKEDWDEASRLALALFTFGQALSKQHGLILVDTKYEFGKDDQGNIILVDELHTPDSSRFWILETYADRFKSGLEPENIDKEFLRLWYVNHCDPYNDIDLPEAPKDLIITLSLRYIELYEKITGTSFSFEKQTLFTNETILKSLQPWIR